MPEFMDKGEYVLISISLMDENERYIVVAEERGKGSVLAVLTIGDHAQFIIDEVLQRFRHPGGYFLRMCLDLILPQSDLIGRISGILHCTVFLG